MTLCLETRQDITLEAFRRVAWQGEGVRLQPQRDGNRLPRGASLEAEALAQVGDRGDGLELQFLLTVHWFGFWLP